MSVIIKRTFDVLGKEECEPIVFVDSIITSSYIEAVNKAVTKVIRKLSFSELVFGSSDVSPYLVKSETEIDSKGPGFWIIKNETGDSYSLTIYEHKVYPGKVLWNSHEIRKVCEFYYVKCDRVVPRIFKKPTKFEKFTDELEKAVTVFKNRAERGVIVENNPELE